MIVKVKMIFIERIVNRIQSRMKKTTYGNHMV